MPAGGSPQSGSVQPLFFATSQGLGIFTHRRPRMLRPLHPLVMPVFNTLWSTEDRFGGIMLSAGTRTGVSFAHWRIFTHGHV